VDESRRSLTAAVGVGGRLASLTVAVVEMVVLLVGGV
jgi:hypothetical protein